MRWGIKAVVAESFAEIFFGNCTSLGIPAVTADRTALDQMNAEALQNSETPFTLDLEKRSIHFAGQTVPVCIPDGAHEALTSGKWDFLTQLLAAEQMIDQTADQLPYVAGFADSV
jgi:3-isopropylmalate/(R)-2-methylmalate dehydratase small subunit